MCSYAHEKNELSVDLLDEMEKDTDFYMFFFKTVWCPLGDSPHVREDCVYAHNWQDFRRKPNLYDYKPENCTNW